MTNPSNQSWWVCSRGHVFGPLPAVNHCPIQEANGPCLDSSHLWQFSTEAEALAFSPLRKRWMPESGVAKALRRRDQRPS